MCSATQCTADGAACATNTECCGGTESMIAAPLAVRTRGGWTQLTLHASGGVDMLKAGVEGLYLGAEGAGLPAPVALAVTVLTSDDSAPPHIAAHRAHQLMILALEYFRKV